MQKIIDRKAFINLLLASLPCLAVTILTLLGGVENFPFPDADEYRLLGRSLTADFSFSPPDIPFCWRVPGYPFCLMLFSGLGSYNFLAVNIFFIFGISWYGMRLAEKFNIGSAYLLPVLILLSPGLIALGSVPLSEIAFTFFLMLSVYYLLSDRIIISGLSLSAATFCRPLSIVLFILFTAWLIRKKKKTLLILLFIALANLLPLFWTVRNYVKYNYPVYTTISGFNLLYYKAGAYLSWKNDIPFDQMRENLEKQVTGNNIFEQNASAGKLGRQILFDNFPGFCLWATENMLNFFMPDLTPLLERLHISTGNIKTLDHLRRKGLSPAFNHYFGNNTVAITITSIYLIFYIAVFAAMTAGFIRLCVEKHYEKLIFGALLTGYFWILPIGNLDWRFRMPVMPFLFILAIYGIRGLAARQLTHQERIS
ncbi:MAG: hypothetical protein PHV82_06260 [Victivallaceae bacterium]|nr:hypothetical protein [Victivallaceae bacterium]